MPEAGPVAARAMMRAMGAIFEAPVGELATIRDIAMTAPNGRSIDLRLYDVRAARAAGPIFVFYHGGGFVIGDRDCYDSACAEISRQMDMPVVSVEYRLAPENPWPAAPDDCEAAARWIAANPDLLGREANGLILIGDSAGGGLAIVTAMSLRDDPAPVPVLAQVALYPVTDLASQTHSKTFFAEGYLLETSALDWFYANYDADRSHWRASPLTADQSGMSPSLIVTCSLDPLRDEGRAYAAALAQAAVPLVALEAQGMIHGFLNFRQALPSANDDMRRMTNALKALLSVTAP